MRGFCRWLLVLCRRFKFAIALSLVVYVLLLIGLLRRGEVTEEENARHHDMPINNELESRWMVKQLAGEIDGDVVEWHRYKPDPKILYSELHEEKRTVKKVRLLILVLSATEREDRRQSIRETWWTQCKGVNKSVVDCFFFTDTVNTTDGYADLRTSIERETNRYKDLITMPIASGLAFGYRFLYMFQWVWSRYDFDYVLRVDDDVLLCVDHLLDNLVKMPKQGMHWGWMHCQNGGLVFMDEGVTMFTRDVVQEFLSQDPLHMHCHPYGDQTVAIWIQEIGLNPYDLYHPDQERIHHHPPASRMVDFRWLNGICDMYIAVHGVYAKDMVDFWKRKGAGTHYNQFIRKDVRSMCNFEPFMYWDSFDDPFYAEPKRCIEKHSWSSNHHHSFRGRENNTAKQDSEFSVL